MARFKHLEIYQSAYKFTREVYQIKTKLPKNLKFDLGEKTLNSCLKIIRGLVIANGTKDRLKVLLQISLENSDISKVNDLSESPDAAGDRRLAS